MLTSIELKLAKKIIGKKANYELCENQNLRISNAHIDFDKIQDLVTFCMSYNIVMTVGKDGVIVIS